MIRLVLDALSKRKVVVRAVTLLYKHNLNPFYPSIRALTSKI